MLIPGALRHRGTPATLGEGAGAYLLSLAAASLCWTRALRHRPRSIHRTIPRPIREDMQAYACTSSNIFTNAQLQSARTSALQATQTAQSLNYSLVARPCSGWGRQ